MRRGPKMIRVKLQYLYWNNEIGWGVIASSADNVSNLRSQSLISTHHPLRLRFQNASFSSPWPLSHSVNPHSLLPFSWFCCLDSVVERKSVMGFSFHWFVCSIWCQNGTFVHQNETHLVFYCICFVAVEVSVQFFISLILLTGLHLVGRWLKSF